MTGVALDHLVGGLEAGVSDLRDGHLLVVGLLCADDWSVCSQWEMDARVGDQVGLQIIINLGII